MNRRAKTAGFLLIAAGMLFNPWICGRIFSASGRMVNPSLISFTLFTEILVIAAGIMLLRVKSEAEWRRTTGNALIFLVTLAVIEFGLHVLHRYYPLTYTPTTRPPLSSSIFRDKPWAGEIVADLNRLIWRFELVDGWRTGEYHGPYTNVDSAGMRATHNPDPDTSKNLVYMFGGSTMWGFYVPDGSTIPSFVSSELNAGPMPCSVRNYGERAFTFTQDVLRLMKLLRKGLRPTTAVFYDGANDVLTSYYVGEAGESWLSPELDQMVQERKGPAMKKLGEELKFYLERHFMLYILWERAVNAILHRPLPPRPEYTQEDLSRLAHDIAAEYRDSYLLLDKLSQAYHFRYRCFLQPVIFTKKNLTGEERETDFRNEDPSFGRLFGMAYGNILKNNLPHVVDISGIFDSVGATTYADFCHISEAGNARVAKVLAEAIKTSGGQ